MNAPTTDLAGEIALDLLRSLPLPTIDGEPDKDARGRVLVVAGGAEVPGAAILTGEGAMRAGAGKLQMAATAAFALPLAFAVPEARVFTVAGNGDFAPDAAKELVKLLPRTDAVVVGPGMIDAGAAQAMVAPLLRVINGPAFVLDAAAMSGLNARITAPAAGRLVLTPHAGEMARLSGKSKEMVLEHPLRIAREVAANLGSVVVMKGQTTHVVAPDGRAWIHRGGMLGLATSGSGDVLAGVIGGLLARGADPARAAIWGVWLHGQAGERLGQRVGPLGFLARELAAEVPAAMASVAGG